MGTAEKIEAYVAGAEEVGRQIEGMGDVELRSRPVQGMWSMLEVVCHLSDSEALFAERMKRVLSEDRPALPFSDPNACAASLAYHDRDAGEEVALIGLLRRQMARILRAQSPAAWRRIGIHSTEGERTLEQLLDKAVSHLEHHLGFLREKRQMILGEV